MADEHFGSGCQQQVVTIWNKTSQICCSSQFPGGWQLHMWCPASNSCANFPGLFFSLYGAKRAFIPALFLNQCLKMHGNEIFKRISVRTRQLSSCFWKSCLSICLHCRWKAKTPDFQLYLSPWWLGLLKLCPQGSSENGVKDFRFFRWRLLGWGLLLDVFFGRKLLWEILLWLICLCLDFSV